MVVPNLTAVAPVKPVPVSVTLVPPAVLEDERGAPRAELLVVLPDGLDGVRYEYDTAMREGLNNSQCAKWYAAPYNWNKCQDRIIGTDLNAINPVSGTPGVITFPKTYYDPYNKALAPRLGFAYNIRSGTVIRGGWGMFYSYPIQWGLRGAPGDVRPDAATVGDFTSPDNGITAPFHMSTGMPSPAPFTPSLLNPGFGSAAIGQRTILSPR